MEFRTTLRLPDNRQRLQHSHRLMLIGSCFSDNIGAKLHGAMMRAYVNPFGTLFNPLSIAHAVNRLITAEPIAGNTLFAQAGLWNSFDFHSRFSMPDKQDTLNRMNHCIAEGHHFLAEAQMLVLTLGTSVVYQLADTGHVVANCHKVPQHRFIRRMADIAESTAALNLAVDNLIHFNPDLHIVLTVSPVRHVADGLEVNSLSKARLRVAADEVVAAHPDRCDYFPAYELLLDDLRDYRFYNADMVHPSDVAIEYVWQAFQATYLDDRAAQAAARCERVAKRLQHRPFAAGSEAAERFAADTAAVLSNLIREYPYLQQNPDLQPLLQRFGQDDSPAQHC